MICNACRHKMDISVDFAIEQPSYNGPLDLLLELIEGDQLAIDQIQLANITSQYLIHIESLELDNTQLNAFLRVAASLIFLKSQFLSSTATDYDNTESNSDSDEFNNEALAKQLKIYQSWRPIFAQLTIILQKTSHTVGRYGAPRHQLTVKLDPNKIASIWQTFEKTRHIKTQLANKPKITTKALPIVARLRLLDERLDKLRRLNLHDLLETTADKPTKIADFLAILELIDKGRAIYRPDREELIWAN